MLRSLRPLATSLGKQALAWSTTAKAVDTTAAASDGLDSRAHRCRDANRVGVAVMTAFDSVPRGKEGVKPLNQVRMASKQLGYAVDDARGIDPDQC